MDMSASLIINARDRLSWHQRLFSDASTVVMWGFWLNLWYPVLRAFTKVPYLDALARRTLRMALATAPVAGVEHYAAALVGTSGTLLVWSRLPSFRVCDPQPRTARDYAEMFGLPESDLIASRESAICVVHHDESGRIVRIERCAP
jgi:poly-beta-1,6-N-acetyl-D-glucosamine biosynthesis protein PgaD